LLANAAVTHADHPNQGQGARVSPRPRSAAPANQFFPFLSGPGSEGTTCSAVWSGGSTPAGPGGSGCCWGTAGSEA
jgi:hypothetical protein